MTNKNGGRSLPSLDRDSRVLAIQLVRRYKRYQENLAQKREEILHGSLPPPDERQEGWEHETLTVSERLSRLEQGHHCKSNSGGGSGVG